MPVTDVTWELPDTDAGTIDETGLFTAGSSSGTYQLRATTDGDGSGGSLPAHASVEIRVDLEALLESLPVPADGSIVSSATALKAGASYMLRASGTAPIGGPGDGLADAEYADFIAPASGLLDGCTPPSAPVDLGIGVDGSDPDWGPYAPSHRYDMAIVGHGAPVSPPSAMFGASRTRVAFVGTR